MDNRLPLINLLSYIVLMIVNVLAVRIPFFGKSPGDVSDLFPNLLTPANFAFKIWSLVYLLLGVFAFYQARPLMAKGGTVPNEVSVIGFLFFTSCICNFCWLLAWQSMHIAWSFAFIFTLWVILILIYHRLAVLKKARWVFTIPFSFYLAWVCVASLANLNVLLIDLDFDFFGLTEEYWTASLIGIGTGGTLLVLYLNADLWFTFVLTWAFFGMYSKNKQIGIEGNWVVIMSILGMVILIIAGMWVGWRKWNLKTKEQEKYNDER